ncbi:MAG: GDSL-type esterase/lipase family protein [Mediterraneibacter faecis]|nr:GDSL-type esterase/lipase family protein [Mediterraneibacter faecis]
MITTDLGKVTAYAEAVAQGYTGTKEEFGKLLANYVKTAEKVAEDKAVAEQAMKFAKESANRASTSEQNAKASENAAAEQAKNVSDNITELVNKKDEALQTIDDKTAESVNAVKRQEETSAQNVTNHTESEIQRLTQETAESKNSLDGSIATANDTKSQVDVSVEAGKKLKEDLDKSIADSGKAKTALDGSVTAANVSKSALDETVGQANVLDTSLSSKIAEGTQLNKEITASGNKAVSDINSASEKALDDINTTGTAKLDAVNKAAEAIVADREQIAKNKTDIALLKEDLADYGFPIPNVNWTDGYLKSDGTIQNGSNYKVSNLIHIPSGFRLVFDSYASTSTYHFCNYLPDGTFESVGLGHAGLTGRHGIKIDAIEDRYVKICNNFVEIQDAKLHFEKLEIQPTKIADISNVLPLSGVTFVKGYLSSSTHNRTDSEVYYCSSLLFIQKGQTIEYKCSGSSGALMLMEVTRDSDYIASLFVGDGKYHRLAYTADHDMWVRICSRTEKGGNYVPLDEFKNSVKFYYKPLYQADEKLNGKIIVVIGDSLIHGNDLGNDVAWCKILENKSGASVYNYGINGNAISSVRGAIGSPMSVRYSDIEELPTADIIIVEGGANDKNNSCPIGALSDANNNTFIGACNVLIDGIRALNPTARLLFMTTYPRYSNADNNGKKEQDFADAMINACRNKSVPCFDNLEIGIDFTNANLKTWCDEGIYLGNTSNQHFSPKGYEFIYPKYKHWIESFC